MTIARYRAQAGALQLEDDGDLVAWNDARRDIERLGNELFAARAQLVTLEKQRCADIACKDEVIAELQQRIDAALHTLDPYYEDDRT